MSGWKHLMVRGWLALGATNSVAQESPVFDNGTNSSNTDFSVLSDDNGQQIVADDVLLTSTALVTKIRWSGAYGNLAISGSKTDDFSIEIYADAGGVPTGAPLATFDVGNDVNRNGPDILKLFEYSADVDFSMQAGITYWITIHRQNNGAPDFFWSAISGVGNSTVSLDGGATWAVIPFGRQMHITLLGQLVD